MNENALTGSIPRDIGQLSELKSLRIHKNQLSGVIPNELGSLNLLTSLSLNENALTGSIPRELGQLSELKSLQLQKNQLSGSIPNELGLLNNLQNLRLYENALTGEIPEGLSQLSVLKSIQFNQNKLSGTIPNQLGFLTKLQIIDLSENELTGAIPAELGQLSELKSLLLHQNQLSGTPVLGNLGQLFSLTLNNNCLNLSSLEPLLLVLNGISRLDLGNQGSCSGVMNIPIVRTFNNLAIEIPSVFFKGNSFKVSMERYKNSADPAGFYWRVAKVSANTGVGEQPENPSVTIDEQITDVTFHRIHFRTLIISATLKRFINPEDASSFYFQLVP